MKGKPTLTLLPIADGAKVTVSINGRHFKGEINPDDSEAVDDYVGSFEEEFQPEIRRQLDFMWDAVRPVPQLVGEANGIEKVAKVSQPFNTTDEPPIEPIPIADLIRDNPTLREPIIDGLLRRGETGNLIAASKVGKSWMTYNVGLSVATGLPLFGHETKLGRVLLIDNELHPEVISKRIPAVADAMSLRQKDYADSLDVLPLRGKSIDLHDLAAMVEGYEAGKYDLVIADAFYRFIPAGVSENENQPMMALYNRLDACNETSGAAWLNVHHASKGQQGNKSVTDTGAGAGAQSRAADAHIVLREHEEPGVYVLDAAVRSFPPIDPIALRFVFPLWERADGFDTGKLKGKLDRREQKQIERDREGKAEILETLKTGGGTVSTLRNATGLSRERVTRLVSQLTAEGKLIETETIARGNSCAYYTLAIQTANVPANVHQGTP